MQIPLLDDKSIDARLFDLTLVLVQTESFDVTDGGRLGSVVQRDSNGRLD
jgi:hypothetical protein